MSNASKVTRGRISNWYRGDNEACEAQDFLRTVAKAGGTVRFQDEVGERHLKVKTDGARFFKVSVGRRASRRVVSLDAFKRVEVLGHVLFTFLAENVARDN